MLNIKRRCIIQHSLIEINYKMFFFNYKLNLDKFEGDFKKLCNFYQIYILFGHISIKLLH